MAHSNSTPGTSNQNHQKGRKSLDLDDSDSSIEIVGEYSMAAASEKKVDLALNLALPSLNKDKYKKSTSAASSAKGSRPSSESGASTSGVAGGMRGSPMNLHNNNNNNSFDKATAAKYRHSPSPASSATATATTTNATGSFALPTSVASLMQEMKANAHGAPSRMSSGAPGELDVLRIMKELHELQAIQISPSSKAVAKHGGSHNNRGSSNSPKPTHSYGPKPKQPDAAGSASNHQTPKSAAASQQQQQKQQQAHHKTPPVPSTNGATRKTPPGTSLLRVLNPMAIERARKNSPQQHPRE